MTSLVLVGSGEFLPTMAEIDGAILARTGKARPRVAILPTAAGLEDPRQWTDMGVPHFAALGAEPHAVMATTREDCFDAPWLAEVALSDVIYLSGGQPHHLVATMLGTPLWDAILARHRAGAVLVGVSAGAMLLGQRAFAFPDGLDETGWPKRIALVESSGVVPGIVVLPHFDIMSPDRFEQFRPLLPADLRLLGIDEDTALLHLDGSWRVMGKGAVRLIHGDAVAGPHRAGAELGSTFLDGAGTGGAVAAS